MHYEFFFIHLWIYVIMFLKRLKKSGREISIQATSVKLMGRYRTIV